MVEHQLVELAVAGSTPVDHPNVEQTYTEIAIFCLPCYDNERINNDKIYI